ncbi:MAG: FmdB family zinc ribbon protein [Nitrospirales bacterium]|nr:transcriptional regulator [Nitrospirales bacterium]
MPIYEYECTSCGKRFEIKQKMSDPTVKTCDQFSCEKAQPVTKVISPPAIMFKGSGWYVTDYSDKFKDGKKTNDGGSGEPKSDTKSESKSESKSETKSETKTSTDKPSTSSGSSTSSSGGSGSGNSSTPTSSSTAT